MRRIWDIYDDLALVDWFLPYAFNITLPEREKKYSLYNPETHELVPRESYKKELIEAKQKELEANEENRKRLEEELNKLKNS